MTFTQVLYPNASPWLFQQTLSSHVWVAIPEGIASGIAKKMSDGATTMVEALTGYAFEAIPIKKKPPILGQIS